MVVLIEEFRSAAHASELAEVSKTLVMWLKSVSTVDLRKNDYESSRNAPR